MSQYDNFEDPAIVPCIHIGIAKTGSTTLQSRLFAHHSGIAYLGKWLGQEVSSSKQPAKDVFDLVMNAMRRPGNVRQARAAYLDWERPAVEAGRTPLLSSEGICTGGAGVKRKRARALHKMLGQCRIVIVLRESVSFAKSMYFQKLKEAQLRKEKQFGSPGRFFTIEEWLQFCFSKSNFAAFSNISYLPTIEIFADVFGRDAVGIFLFEELKDNSEQFVRRLCDFVDIDPDEGASLAARQVRNPQLTQAQYELIQAISGSSRRSLDFRFSSLTRRRQILLNPDLIEEKEKAVVDIPGDWANRLRDFNREANRKLLEEWNVPLDRYGYGL